MNADRLLAATLLIMIPAVAVANETLETTYRTNGPKMHQLLGEGPAKISLQQSSAVIQKGRTEMAYGVVVSPDGYIMTKASEVPELNGVSVIVDQQTYKEVKLIATDVRWDIALLKIEASGLVPVRFSTSSDPDRGTWVVANGTTSRKDRNPQVGVISATAREIKEKDGVILGVAFDDDDGELVISDLAEEGEAKTAGLEIGDVIVSIQERPVKSLDSLEGALNGRRIGESVIIAATREGQPVSATVVLGEMITRNDQMSGLNRSSRRTGFPRVIQHDVIADRERMGGPVFDLDGICLGMNIARADRCETYAIPAQELKVLAEEMIGKTR